MYCESCGHEIKSDEKFCSSCGAVVKVQDETKSNVCTNCETQLLESDKFCPSCGTSRGVSQPLEQNICKKCKAVLSDQEKFCSSCGQGVDQPLIQDSVQQPQQSKPEAPQKSNKTKITVGGILFFILFVSGQLYKTHLDEVKRQQAEEAEAERQRIAQEEWDNDMPNDALIQSAATQCWENVNLGLASQSVTPIGVVATRKIDHKGFPSKAVQVNFTKTEQLLFAAENKTKSAVFVKKEPLVQNQWEILCDYHF